MKDLWTEKYRPSDISTYVFRDEKQKQIVVLSKIAEHLDKLIMNTTDINNQAAVLKEDQKIILDKLSTVRYELEEITQ